jgi:hypothetical protein
VVIVAPLEASFQAFHFHLSCVLIFGLVLKEVAHPLEALHCWALCICVAIESSHNRVVHPLETLYC